MDTLLDRVQLAFLRLFGDILGGNLDGVLITDVGIVAITAAIPVLAIGSFLGSSRI